MHNAIVNSTGLVLVVGLPPFEVLVIMAGIVVLACGIIAVGPPMWPWISSSVSLVTFKITF
jgi:hypothetical protein